MHVRSTVADLKPELIIAIFTRGSYAKRVLTIVESSTRPFVRPSVTPCFKSIKTMQARITKSLICDATNILLSCDIISYRLVKGFPSKKGVKEKHP